MSCRHGACPNEHAARHDDGKWHAHAAWNGHGRSRHDRDAHAASLTAAISRHIAGMVLRSCGKLLRHALRVHSMMCDDKQ